MFFSTERRVDVNNGYHFFQGPSRLQLSKPLIAAVSGFAVAGGLELALLADLRVVEESAVMGVFCRRFGMSPCIMYHTALYCSAVAAGCCLTVILDILLQDCLVELSSSMMYICLTPGVTGCTPSKKLYLHVITPQNICPRVHSSG